MTADGNSSGSSAPNPGSGKATSGGECSDATPCFVCELKALVRAQGIDGKFHDEPYAINIVGVRRTNSITDKFDDRMIAFFALPADESAKNLKDGGIEDDGAGKSLISDINDAATAINGASKNIYRGVRRIPCSRIELVAGKPAAGDRVALMWPITTDPGLVRLDKDGKQLQTDIAARKKDITDSEAQQTKLEDAKKTLHDKLLPDLKAKGQALTKIPPPKKNEAKSPEREQAEKDVADAQKAIEQLAQDLGMKSVTEAVLDQQIAAKKAAIARLKAAEKDLEAKYAGWSSRDLDSREKKRFEGYHYAFQTDQGWEGDGHALFPVGHLEKTFELFLHHWSSESAMPALTIGEFLGERVITGRTLKLEYSDLIGWPRQNRINQASAAAKPGLAALTQKLNSTSKTDLPARKAAQDALDAARAAAADAAEVASREYLTVVRSRPAPGVTQPAAGTQIVLGCEVQTPDGTAALVPGDQFVLKGDPHQRSGRDVCNHYYDLTKTLKSPAGLTIATHLPSGDGVPLPAGSKIVAKGIVFDANGTQTPIPDDLVMEVEAMIGGTNLHRGHLIDGSTGTVVPSAENADKVNNWSTGCQVTPYFFDYNLFILLAGLSKRWTCLHKTPVPACPRIQTGSATAPDPFVWAHATTTASLPTDALNTEITTDTKSLQDQRAAAQADVKGKLDAWFKAQKKARPRKDDDAEAQVVAAYDQRTAELVSKVAADQAAVAAAPDGSPERTQAQTALQQDTDQQTANTTDQQALAAAIAKRKDLDARLEALKKVGSGMGTKAEPFEPKKADLAAQAKSFGDLAATYTDKPEAKRLALAAQQADQALIDTTMPADAYNRAVKMNHDWMRECDLAQTCRERFSYTLIELATTDPTGKMQSVEALDQEFAKKVGGADAYPKWSGFGVK